VQSHLRELTLLDARAPARWRGEAEPIDRVAGRIPGSLNRYSNDNLQADGTFKRPAALKQEFLSVLGARKSHEVVHSCGSGVAACHNLLAMEVAGLQGGKLYAGSWSEWIADPARPRESG
jgi:thiosulfate/3-mercaptopyruvate sulfurtransferase